jgi:hypothetical protein
MFFKKVGKNSVVTASNSELSAFPEIFRWLKENCTGTTERKDVTEYRMRASSFISQEWKEFLVNIGQLTPQQYLDLRKMCLGQPCYVEKAEALDLLQLLTTRLHRIHGSLRFSLRYKSRQIHIYSPEQHLGKLIGKGGKDRIALEQKLRRVFGQRDLMVFTHPLAEKGLADRKGGGRNAV